MASGIAAACLALALVAQAPEQNVCDGPANEACEALLARAALTWEQRYSMERAAHIETINLCTEALSVQPPPDIIQPESNGLLLMMLKITGGLVLAGGLVVLGATAF